MLKELTLLANGLAAVETLGKGFGLELVCLTVKPDEAKGLLVVLALAKNGLTGCATVVAC